MVKVDCEHESTRIDISYSALHSFCASPECAFYATPEPPSVQITINMTIQHNDQATQAYDSMNEPTEDHKGYDLVLHITVDWQKHREPKHNRAGGVCIAQTRECTSTGRVLERQKSFWYEFNHELYWIRTFQLAHMTAILYAFRHARTWNTSTWQAEAVDAGYKLQAIRFKIWHPRDRHEETVPLMNHFLDNPDQLSRARSLAKITFNARQQFSTELSKDREDYGIQTTMRKILGAMEEMTRCHDGVPIHFEEGSDRGRVNNLMTPKLGLSRKAKARKRRVLLQVPYRPRTFPLCRVYEACPACIRNGALGKREKKKKARSRAEMKREGMVKQENVKQEQESDFIKSEDVKQEDVKQEDIKQETKVKLEGVEQVKKVKLEYAEQPAFNLYAYAAYTGS